MSKKLKIYQVLTFALGIAFVVLCAYMGITAVQKSMKLKVGFEITPTFECKIVYNGNTIFCNSTKDPNGTFVGNGFTLDGNTLSFNQSFEDIGKTFVLTIYNYSDVSIKISVSGTNASGGPLTLAAYENSAPSGELTLVTTGASEAILTFEEYTRPPYTIYQYGDTENGAVVAPNDGWVGYSYVVFDEATTYNGYDLRWIIIGAGTNNHSLVPTTVSTARVNSNVDGAELSANQVLLLSEYVLTSRVYNNNFSNSEANRGWAVSDLRSYLNDSGSSNFLEQSGLSAYSQYIKSDNTIKTRWYGEIETIENQSVFVLTTNTYSNEQSFMAETYLGADYTNARFKTFQGASTSNWWLRSGGYYSISGSGIYTNEKNNISNNASVFVATAGLSAYSVSSNGCLECSGLSGLYLNNTQGVRPSFVLNLA